MSQMTPREIVQELDKHIIGQERAKRAVAIALRNRWRRQQVPESLRNEITPKNILMIGPTGIGKTEIARRLARLANAPFLKVEATKFTEVGYVGRDVDSIVRDLTDADVKLTRETETAVAGNIVGISGFEDVDIGDTLTIDENGHALPFTQIDPPTLEMQFCVNDGPLVGTEGKLVTSRQLRERLYREAYRNVSIRVEEPTGGEWTVVNSSHPAAREDANTITFDVPVQKRGKTKLTYKVRVRWCCAPRGSRRTRSTQCRRLPPS